MKLMTSDEIQGTFNDALAKEHELSDESGHAEAIRNLALAIKSIQDAGFNVSASIHRTDMEVYSMFRAGASVHSAGTITIGDSHYKFGFFTRDNGETYPLSLRISNFDLKNSPEINTSSWIYKDFSVSENVGAFKDVQAFILNRCAQLSFLNSVNTKGALDIKPAQTNKRKPKDLLSMRTMQPPLSR